MSSASTVDLTTLPRSVSGTRSTVIWGIALLIVIEAVAAVSLFTSYFYLRVAATTWPPAAIARPDPGWSGVALAISVASVVPVALAERGIARGSQLRLKLGLPIGLLLLLAYGGMTVWEARGRTYTWATNVYGSIVWLITGFELTHVLALLLLASTVTVLAWRGRFTASRRVGVQATALYWYFVVANGLLSYATVYLAPRVL